MQVSRDGKIPVAMFEEDAAIMSPAYPMFEVIDKTVLLPRLPHPSQSALAGQRIRFRPNGMAVRMPLARWLTIMRLFVRVGVVERAATVSPCFHYNIKYVDATGKTVEVNNISAPWTLPVFDVKSPYTAKVEGTIVYNESDLPEEGPINFGAVPNIHVSANGKTYDYGDPIAGSFSSKQQFLDFIATHLDRLKFKVEKTF